MDLASKSNYWKPTEEQDMAAVACNIDDLPEAILVHILSFVRTEDAVRTCVLSKKWRYLWTSLPNLALSEQDFSRREHFTNFMERLLLQGSSRIERFYLTCNVLGDASLVHLWVFTAVKRSVEECFLHLSDIPGNFFLPYCLFTCATLTHLKLFISGALILPSQIFLPNLKHLLLGSITFVDKGTTEQLLSSPVLEELTIINCNWDNLETLNIRAPMLKILTIRDVDFDYSSLHPHSCRVLIHGNNLESIHCISPFLNDYLVEKSCSLVEAHINVSECHLDRTEQVAYRLYKLLEAMCSVKKLTLSSTAVQVLSSVDEVCSHLPVFPNLKLLDFGRLDLRLQVIIKLLHNAPHLETLQLSEGIDLCTGDDEDGAILDPAPSCFGSHLRQIVVFHLFPCEEVVHVLKSLLKHAMVLEKFMIYRRWPFPGLGFEENFRKRLLETHRGSKSFEITILLH